MIIGKKARIGTDSKTSKIGSKIFSNVLFSVMNIASMHATTKLKK
jgi:hypothetical protein